MRCDLRAENRATAWEPKNHDLEQPGISNAKPRSLSIAEWPELDRRGWSEALRPPQRLKRGGAASHLAPVSQGDIANRYGLYLDYLQRRDLLRPRDSVATLVTADNVQEYLVELKARVRSVTVWNSIYKLRRAAQLIAPACDFQWLAEIEKDIALLMIPRSKASRLVLTERLVEAGLTLIQEAELFGKTEHARAVGVRNGLLIALLALHPVRIKNFAALSIAETFINVSGQWWLHIPADNTKSHRMDERQVPEFMTGMVDSYIETHRPVLCRGGEHSALWVSSTTGRKMTAKNIGTLVSKLTLRTIGVDVSPHLFRAAGASTAAIYGNKHPDLGSMLLNHRGARITQEHYNLSTSLRAVEEYVKITQLYRRQKPKI